MPYQRIPLLSEGLRWGAAAAESRWKNREAKKGFQHRKQPQVLVGMGQQTQPGLGGVAQTLVGMAPATAPGETQILSLCNSPPPSRFFINSVVFKREQRGCKSEAISQVR